ncbi:MAG: two-component system sensor histidine kinase CreC [Chthoniobacterales bacterium]
MKLFGIRLPGLHSIHWKVFIFHMLVLIVPITYIAVKVERSIETSYLHSTEEGMIDTAVAVSELYTRILRDPASAANVNAEFSKVFANLQETLPLKSRLFGYTKNEVDVRLLAYDVSGRVVFDTEKNNSSLGADFSQWRDVSAALNGQYGSRWELDRPRQRVHLFSTLPVVLEGKVVGAVSVVKPTNRIRNFVSNSLRHLLVPGAIAILMAAALAYALSGYITRIIGDLATRAERVAAGEPNVRLQTWTRSELGTLARAVEKMREKLEGKAYVEEMVSNFSHELKTPLASIRGAAELLEGPAAEDPTARVRFLSNIRTDVQRFDRIVTNFLKLSRIEAGAVASAPDAIDVAAVCDEIASRYREEAGRLSIKFESQRSANARVRIGETELKQILSNLLDNALQFTPAGGEISLTSDLDDGHVVFRVRDSGTGIERELLPKIFDRFFTTENPRTNERGTGLGLAIVRSLVETHQGHISVRSDPGHGAEFTVRFPRA